MNIEISKYYVHMAQFNSSLGINDIKNLATTKATILINELFYVTQLICQLMRKLLTSRPKFLFRITHAENEI